MTTLAAQKDALELAIQGMEARLEAVTEKARAGKWPAHDIEIKRTRLVDLRAALKTLAELASDEEFYRGIITARKKARREAERLEGAA